MTTPSRKVLFISLVILLITSQAGTVSAGINIWTSIGPEGKVIRALAIDPATPTTPYARTENGGVFAMQQIIYPYQIYPPIVLRG